MKTVKNTATTPLEIGINGIDYTFPAGEIVACEDEIADYIKSQFELFEVERLSVGKEGDAVPRVGEKPSKIYTKAPSPTQSMFVKKIQKNDTSPKEEQPNGVDADGVEWVGQGIEKDTAN